MNGSRWVVGGALLLVSGMGCDKGKGKGKQTSGGGTARWELKAYVARDPKVAKYTTAGLRWAMVAEVERGSRRAAIFYPALIKGRLIDNDIVALVFERDGQGWRKVSRTFGVHRRGGKDTLMKKLRGQGPTRVIRPCGFPKAKLAAHLRRWGAWYFERLEAGDDAGAMAAYEQIIRAFAFDFVAHGTAIQSWLGLGVKEPGSWPVVSSVEKDRALLTFARRGHSVLGAMTLTRCGKGWVLAGPVVGR